MENNFPERVKTILTSGALIEPKVVMIKKGYRWIASIVSPTFEGINEAEGQALVWDILAANLTEEEHRQIVYVSIRSPREAQAMAA